MCHSDADIKSILQRQLNKTYGPPLFKDGNTDQPSTEQSHTDQSHSGKLWLNRIHELSSKLFDLCAAYDEEIVLAAANIAGQCLYGLNHKSTLQQGAAQAQYNALYPDAMGVLGGRLNITGRLG
jgi:hypothetical protein